MTIKMFSRDLIGNFVPNMELFLASTVPEEHCQIALFRENERKDEKNQKKFCQFKNLVYLCSPLPQGRVEIIDKTER